MSTLTQTKDTNGNTGMIVKRVSVPIGLEELMEGLSKEVILRKPKDIYLFASEYFTKLINLREKSNIYKSHPVRTMQSVTKLKHENIPPVTKISTARPTKHLSRQLSIHSKSPIRQKLIQNETATKRNITKNRERKIGTDRKDNIAGDFPKTASSRNVSVASNKKGGTSTGTSSVQSTPREKRQSSVTRKVKSSLIDDPNKAREINNKTHKSQKRNKSEIVKTALIVPTVIGGNAVAANIVEAVKDNIIKETEKNQIIDSTDSAESTKLSLTTKDANNTGILESVIKQVDKGNTDKLELNDQSTIKESLDSDILAQSTNVAEVAKNIYRSEEEPETLKNQKVDVRSNSENNSHVTSLEREGEQLKDAKSTADQENNQNNINQEAKRTQKKSHDDETSPDITDQNLVSIISRHSSVEGNDLELERTDKETIRNRLTDNISTKELLLSNKDVEKQSENENETAAEGLSNDNKLHVETGEDILDKTSESIMKVDAKKDEHLKSNESKNNISSEEKVGISDITIQEKGSTEEVSENLENKINNDHSIPTSEAESLDMMHSNLRIGDPISEQRSDVEDNDNIKSNTESLETHVKENIDINVDKGIEAQNNLVNIDICHKDSPTQENKDQESKMKENVIMLQKKEESAETKELQIVQELIDDKPEDTPTHKVIKKGQLTNLENKNVISNSEIQITSMTSAPTSGTPEDKSIITSESQCSDTEVKDKMQEKQMDMTEEQTKDSENVKALLSDESVEHQRSDLLTISERKHISVGNEDQLKEIGAKEKTIQTSGENQQNKRSDVTDVLNTNDQVTPVELTDLSDKTHIQNNIFTIKMEKSASVKSDDVLTVSILDNLGIDNNIKESDNDENRSVENIAISSNDTKQEQNQFFRKDEELAIDEDDKTKINIESSDSKTIEGSQGQSEKIFANIKDTLSDHPYETDSFHKNVSNIPMEAISPDSKMEIGDTKYVKETDQKPHNDSLLNKPDLPSTQKETYIDNLHTENSNADQNNITANNEVTKKIINYELSKNLPGLIDSPVKEFLGSFINNEQNNVFKSKDIDSVENDKPSTNMTSNDEPEQHVSKKEDEGIKDEKDTDAESTKISKGILPTESIEVYAGNPLIFSSVKDLLDFDTDNALKSDITKISESQDKDNAQVLEHDRANTEMVENAKNDTKRLENYVLKENDLIINEETQEKNKRSITEGKETQEGSNSLASSLQNSRDSEIISKEFDHVNEENINMEKNAKTALKIEKSENLEIDEQTKTKIDNLEIHPKMSTPINRTEKDTKGTASDTHNTTTAKNDDDNIGYEKNLNSSDLGTDETDDKLKEINEILGSDHAPKNTIISTNAPENVDKKDDTVDQIDNDKIIELALTSENLSKIGTTSSEAKRSESDMNIETDNNVQVGSTEIKISDNSETKDKVDSNILKTRTSENDITSTNNHPNLDGSKEILNEDVTPRMYTNNDAEENRRDLSLNNIDAPKEDAKTMEINKANQQQTGEIASALNTIKNIMASNISVQKPGVLDTSVTQYLTSFLGNEQSNVFQDKSFEQNKSEVYIDKSKEQSTIKNNKLIPDKENLRNNSTGSKIKKSNKNVLILKKMERSYSQDNVLSNDGHISESAIKTTKMRRVRSVGLIKSGETEHKSKIPTSARRSAGRRPLIRQLETDSKDLEEQLGIEKDLDNVNQDARRKSNEEDDKIVLRNAKNTKKKMKQASDETETDKIKDKRQEPKEHVTEKNINKIDIRQDAVTKEDVLIAKTILKGIEGAERHIELIEEKIAPNENKNSETDQIKSDIEDNTKLVTEQSAHKAVVDTSTIDTNTMKDKKKSILYVSQQFETMPQEEHESRKETHVTSEPMKDVKESSLENRTDDKTMSEESMLSNSLLESDPRQTINKIVVTKTLPSSSEGLNVEKTHLIDSNKAITETNNSNQSNEIKDNTAGIKAATEDVQKSEHENSEKYISENVITDILNKTTTNNQQKGKQIKDNDDGADIEQDEAIVKEELIAQHLKESNAAVKIQSLWRGRITRKIMQSSDLKLNQKSNRRKMKQEEAIIKIQAVVRGYLDRLKYKKLKDNGTQELKISHDDKSLVENNGNLLETSFSDSTKGISDNNAKTFGVESKRNKNSGENLYNDINPVEINNYITDKEKITSDIKESNGKEQPPANDSENTNKNILSNQKERVNDDILEIFTSQNKEEASTLMENGNISEINTDKITEKVILDKTVGQNHGKEIEEKLSVTKNSEDQGEESTDKNEQEQNMKAAGLQDISAAANTNKSEASHDERLEKQIEVTFDGEHTFTGTVNQKTSEDRETKSVDVAPNNGNDKQRVGDKNIEESLNGHINKESLIYSEITSSNNNLNDNNVDKEKESIEHIKSQENLNDENVIGDDLNKQIKEPVKDASNGSKLSEEAIEGNIGDQNLSDNTLDKDSVEEEKNINNNSDQVKIKSKEIESVNNLANNLNNAVKLPHDKIDKQVSKITILDETADQERETFKQEHNIHEADIDKPYFYRSDTVVEPNNVKKIVSQLTKSDIENQQMNDNIELSAKDDNNNTETKEETELESEVRSTVNKILNDNSEPSIEIEIKKAVKNIMENNIDNNKPTSENNSSNPSEIEKESENVENIEETHDIPEHHMITTIEKNGAQTLSEINDQSDKTTSDDVAQAVLYDVLKEGMSVGIPPTEKDKSADQSRKNENNDNVRDSSEKDIKNNIDPKNIEQNDTQAILSETNPQSENPTNHIGQTILFDSSKTEKLENDLQTKKDQETLYQSTKNENNVILSAVSDTDRDIIENGNDIHHILILSTDPDNVSDLSEKHLQSDIDSKNIDAKGTQAMISETNNVQPDKTKVDINQTALPEISKIGASENLTPTEKDQSTKNENNLILSTAPDNVSDSNEKDLQSGIGLKNIDENGTQAMISETNIQSDKTENATALQNASKEAISHHVAPTEKDEPVEQSIINKNIRILSPTPSNVNDLNDNDLKGDKDPSHSQRNADDVSSVDSIDSVITVVPNVNYDTSIEMKHVSSGHNSTLPNRSLSQDIIKDNKEDSSNKLVKKSLSTDALDGHVELLDQVQKTLLDQICGKAVNTTSKFDIEQLRKELHEASSLYNEENEDPDFATHHDELLEYLNDFEPEDENTYDSKIIKTPIRELPDIEEEIDANADDTESITRRVLESKPDQQLPEFCKTPSTTSVEKCIDNKPSKDHVEVLNLEKLKQGHNEIIINNDNIQINRTESDNVGKQITEDNDQKLLHSSELHDSVMIPMDSSSRSALVHSGRLTHTSEFHDTLVVPLPSGSDVNIKNEAKEMLMNDNQLPEPTRTESVDTGNQTAFQQSPVNPWTHCITHYGRKKFGGVRSRDRVGHLQSNGFQTGAPIVTSRRSSQDGADDVEAQASLRDTSPAKPKSVESFTHQSQPQLPRFVKQDMESENNNKKNNAISTKVSSSGKNMEAEAATKIQAGFRGYQVRKQMKSKNVADKSNLERHQLRRKSSGRKIMKDTDLAEKSAVKIQAGVRGFLVRRRQKKQLNSSASA